MSFNSFVRQCAHCGESISAQSNSPWCARCGEAILAMAAVATKRRTEATAKAEQERIWAAIIAASQT